MANEFVELDTSLPEAPPDGAPSQGSQSIFSSIYGDAVDAADYARFDFYMATGLDSWCLQLFGEEFKLSGDASDGLWETFTTRTNVQFIAYDALGIQMSPAADDLPIGKLVGVNVEGLGHAFPKVIVNGIGLEIIWSWLQGAP